MELIYSGMRRCLKNTQVKKKKNLRNLKIRKVKVIAECNGEKKIYFLLFPLYPIILIMDRPKYNRETIEKRSDLIQKYSTCYSSITWPGRAIRDPFR